MKLRNACCDELVFVMICHPPDNRRKTLTEKKPSRTIPQQSVPTPTERDCVRRTRRAKFVAGWWVS